MGFSRGAKERSSTILGRDHIAPPSLPSPAEPFCPFAKRRETTFWPKDPFVPLLPASSCGGPFVRGAVSLLFYLRRALSPPNLNGPEEGNKMYHVYKREYRHERCKRYYKRFLSSCTWGVGHFIGYFFLPVPGCIGYAPTFQVILLKERRELKGKGGNSTYRKFLNFPSSILQGWEEEKGERWKEEKGETRREGPGG